MKKEMTVAEALAWFAEWKQGMIDRAFAKSGVSVKDRLFHAAAQALARGDAKPMATYKRLVAMAQA